MAHNKKKVQKFLIEVPDGIFLIVSHLQRPESMLHAMYVMQWLRWKKLFHSGFERLEIEGIWKNILRHGVPEPFSPWNKGAIKLLYAVGFELSSKTMALRSLSGASFGNNKFWNDPCNFIGTPSIEVTKKVRDHQHHDAVAMEATLQLGFHCLWFLLLSFGWNQAKLRLP